MAGIRPGNRVDRVVVPEDRVADKVSVGAECMAEGMEPAAVENTVSVPVEDYSDWAGKVSAQMTTADRVAVPVAQWEVAEVMVEAAAVAEAMAEVVMVEAGTVVAAAVTVLLPAVLL